MVGALLAHVVHPAPPEELRGRPDAGPRCAHRRPSRGSARACRCGIMTVVTETAETPAAPSSTEAADLLLEVPSLVFDIAREALAEEIGRLERVGDYAGAVADDEIAVTVQFEATEPGYQGWRWSVTTALAEPGRPTVSEVVLLPGPGALLAPGWVPWSDRVRPGDLSVGDLLPPALDDPRLVPGYAESTTGSSGRWPPKSAWAGNGCSASRAGRRSPKLWHEGPFGPGDEMAIGAPGRCATCGFYLPLVGSLGASFGGCGNEFCRRPAGSSMPGTGAVRTPRRRCSRRPARSPSRWSTSCGSTCFRTSRRRRRPSDAGRS